jgi:hypothetical protein
MIETTGFALAAVAYGVIVSAGSMATAAYFNNIHSLFVGHATTLIIWCGGGIGLLAYAKQKLGKPAFNTACSLACMVISVNLVRDGTSQSFVNFRERSTSTIQCRLYPTDTEDYYDGSTNFELDLLYPLAAIGNYQNKVPPPQSLTSEMTQ